MAFSNGEHIAQYFRFSSAGFVWLNLTRVGPDNNFSFSAFQKFLWQYSRSRKSLLTNFIHQFERDIFFKLRFWQSCFQSVSSWTVWWISLGSCAQQNTLKCNKQCLSANVLSDCVSNCRRMCWRNSFGGEKAKKPSYLRCRRDCLLRHQVPL